MRVNKAAVLLVSVVGGLLIPAAPAAAMPGVHCGDTISQDVVLTANLTCTGDGLIVAENASVTINLHGYALHGSGTGDGISNGDPREGNSHDVTAITVENGTISGFDTGIEANATGIDGHNVIGALRVQSVRFVNNRLAVTSAQADGNSTPFPVSYISNSVFRGNGAGAVVAAGTITNSSFDHTTGLGVLEYGNGGYAKVTRSRFTNNGAGASCWYGGLYVTGSVFRGNGDGIGGRVFSGPQLGTQTCNVYVTHSTFSGSQVGIRMALWLQGWVTDSIFTNTTVGIESENAVSPTGYSVEHDTFLGNGATGLYLHQTHGEATTVTGNKFLGNGYAPGSWVTPAGAPLNAGAWSDSAVFTGNIAAFNAGYGIEGYGVTDGGGNIAFGNGTPGQCLGVTCAG